MAFDPIIAILMFLTWYYISSSEQVIDGYLEDRLQVYDDSDDLVLEELLESYDEDVEGLGQRTHRVFNTQT